MKQKLLLACIAAAAVMTSCSNDEVLEVNKGRAIDFRSAIASRATETTLENLDSIFVTAFNENKLAFPYFENLKFTQGGSTNMWFSEEKYYFPGDNSSLTFHAYAPSAADMGATITSDSENKNVVISEFTTAEDITKQVDIIYASAVDQRESAAADGVFLTFKHALSQVVIKAKSASTGYNYEVKGVRIAMVDSKGSFDFNEAKWTLGEDAKKTYTMTYNDAVVLGTDAKELMNGGENAMLLPQALTAWDWDGGNGDKENTKNGAYLAVLVKITTKDDALVYPFNEDSEDYAWAAIPVEGSWEAGKRYVYTLDFTSGAGYVDPTYPVKPGEPILVGNIRFNVDIEGWADENLDIDAPGFEEDIVEQPGESEGEDPFGDE